MSTTTGTFGVDLAAQPRHTAACMIEWDDRGRGHVDCPTERMSDPDLLFQLTREDFVTRVAIDAPFGWPDTFFEMLAASRAGGEWVGPPSPAALQSLRLRATDFVVRETTGITPLSVSTDRIGVVAMRCVRLLCAAQAELGAPIDRSGNGRALEVYPAASLHQWGLSPKSSPDPGTYKGTEATAQARREWIVDGLCRSTAEWLEVSDEAQLECIKSDHCLDAFISALTARAAERGLLEPVDDLAAAQSEGWIRLPRPGSLAELGPR